MRLALLLIVLVTALAAPAAHAADPLAALRKGCEVKRSTDTRPSTYRICSGKVASFDGTELDVTLTMAARTRGRRLPLVVMLHGLLSSKAEYLSTSRWGVRGMGANAYKTVRWNNVWFAGRGYVALNYTARGHGDSGGKIELASRDVEVRDTQYLTGLLADESAARRPLVRILPSRVGVIGGSYGGGQAWLLLTTRGNSRLPYGSWLSPGKRRVSLGAVIPSYTWTDLLYSLVPNGRHLSGEVVDPATATTPIGIGKQTIANGFLITSGGKLPDYATRWLARFDAGEPYDRSDPVIAEAVKGLTVERSAYYQEGYFAALGDDRQPRVPVLAGQGFTDPIFGAIESVRMYRALKAQDADFPIGLYFGDFEHLTAAAKVLDLNRFHVLGDRLLDHYLRRRGRKPALDVQAALTSCDKNTFGPVFRAKDFDSLAKQRTLIGPFTPQRETHSPLADPLGPMIDPVAVSLSKGRGCITTSQPSAPGVAAYDTPVTRGFEQTLVGMPLVRLTFTTVATDIEINARLWDVAPDGSRTLVTRGAYRSLNPSPMGESIRFELNGAAWRFDVGHHILLEILQDDSPFMRADNFPSSALIDDVRLSLPVRG
jgi:ABC-2 type transport system ATP-binding protein